MKEVERLVLIERAQNEDLISRDLLVASFLPLLRSISFKIKPIGILCSEDYHQAGYFGLIKAIDSFNASLGIKFITYAHKSILRSIFREIHEIGRTIRLTSSNLDSIYKIRSFYKKKLGCHLRNEELLSKIIYEDEWKSIPKLASPQRLLKASVEVFNTCTIGELPLKSKKNTLKLVEEKLDSKLLLKYLKEILTIREQECFFPYCITDVGITTRKLGEKFGVSPQSVSNRILSAKNKLIKVFKDQKSFRILFDLCSYKN